MHRIPHPERLNVFNMRSVVIFTSLISAACGSPMLELRSPAKINLFLRVTAKYPTGYHQLASLFHTVSVFDTLAVSRAGDDATSDNFQCAHTQLGKERSNLVTRALDLMRIKTRVYSYFDVTLVKKIPLQAGLGGGSSNAATAMFAFNELCSRPANVAQLAEWSAELGADVPFFFSNGCAFCVGRGDEVQPIVRNLPDSSNVAVDIIKPRAGLSTGNVFSALRLGQCSDAAPDHLLAEFTGRGIIRASKRGSLVNDLEEPAFRCLPVLAEIKRDVEEMAQREVGGICGCAMTGSGSALFVLRDVRIPGGSRAVEEVLRRHAGDLEPVVTSHLVSRNTAGGLGSWY